MSRVDAVGLARQTAGMGTKVTTAEYFPPVESGDVTQNREELTIEETSGNRFPTGLDYGTRYFEVALSLAPRLSSLPRELSGFLGQPTTAAGGDPGTHVHTFDPAAAGKTPEPHSMFVLRRDPSPSIVDLFFDGKGNQLEFSCAANEFMRANESWIFLDLDDAQSEPAITTDSSHRRKFTEITATINVDGAGATTFVLASFGFTYNNNLDTDEAVLGSRKLYALPVGNADCEVTFSPRESLASHYRRAMLSDPDTVEIILTATGPVIAGTTTEKIVVDVKACEYVDAPAPVSGADVLKMIEVTARAKYDTASSKFVTVTVTNDVATY